MLLGSLSVRASSNQNLTGLLHDTLQHHLSAAQAMTACGVQSLAAPSPLLRVMVQKSHEIQAGTRLEMIPLMQSAPGGAEALTSGYATGEQGDKGQKMKHLSTLASHV